jgi:hypothetical protein
VGYFFGITDRLFKLVITTNFRENNVARYEQGNRRDNYITRLIWYVFYTASEYFKDALERITIIFILREQHKNDE